MIGSTRFLRGTGTTVPAPIHSSERTRTKYCSGSGSKMGTAKSKVCTPASRLFCCSVHSSERLEWVRRYELLFQLKSGHSYLRIHRINRSIPPPPPSPKKKSYLLPAK